MDFEERWGFAPDSDYEELKCNKTPEEIRKIQAEALNKIAELACACLTEEKNGEDNGANQD